MSSKSMYRVLIVTVLMMLMVIGIYIGVEITDNDVKEFENNIIASNMDAVKIYDDEAEIISEEDKIMDVDIKYTDIYPDCGHNIESIEHESSTSKSKVKKSVEEKDLGYRLIGEQEGILIYQKVHTGKCMNHYKVILENDVVEIYRINKLGEYELYQTTEITSNMLRDGIKEQLEKGIEVDDIEELLLLMEDIES